MFCKHKHIRTIVASILLYKAKEVEASKPMKIEDSECGTLAYIGIALTLLSMAIVILLALQKIEILQRTQILKQCKISIVHFRCTALHTNKALQNIRKPSLIQNYRHIDIRRCQVK